MWRRAWLFAAFLFCLAYRKTFPEFFTTVIAHWFLASGLTASQLHEAQFLTPPPASPELIYLKWPRNQLKIRQSSFQSRRKQHVNHVSVISKSASGRCCLALTLLLAAVCSGCR